MGKCKNIKGIFAACQEIDGLIYHKDSWMCGSVMSKPPAEKNL